MSDEKPESWRVVWEERDRLRSHVAQLRDELTAANLQRDCLKTALTRLTNEVRGVMSYAEVDLRTALGNTNFSVLMTRTLESMDALTALAAPATKTTPPHGGSGDL
jgi:hypothetical protein